MDILKYLQEKEEYYFDRIEEPEDSSEEELDDYGLDFVDDEKYEADYIDVEDIPNNSDPIINADEFMYSNSEPISYYSKGNGFDLTDNQDLYEIVKDIKDLTDKHLYVKDLVWKVDIKNRKANFSFILRKEDSDEVNNFFITSLNQFIHNKIYQKYQNKFKIEDGILIDEYNIILKITIEKDMENAV